jgi:hypothetical protein
MNAPQKKYVGLMFLLVAFSSAIGVSLATLSPIEQSESHPMAAIASMPRSAAPRTISATLDPPESTPADPALDDFPHQRLELIDRAQPGTDFYELRSQLRQAVQTRNADFVKALISPDGLGFGFGRPIPRQALDDLNAPPGSILWAALEHAIAIGCQDFAQPSNYSTADPNALIWTCPNVRAAFDRQYPAPPDLEGVSYEISRAIVVGEKVNVRARPDRTSPVIGQLSNEVVQFDRKTWEQIPPEERVTQLDSPDSWTPVILPNQRSGYVSNRYVYFPLGYQAVFGKVKGNWQLLYMPGGD